MLDTLCPRLAAWSLHQEHGGESKSNVNQRVRFARPRSSAAGGVSWEPEMGCPAKGGEHVVPNST